MYISKIEIKNFRIFDDVGVTIFFKKGVNAIISENNCGKTAIIDAIRIAFSTIPYKKDIFFNLSDFHVNQEGIRCNEAFISIYFEDILEDFFEIWDPENPQKGELHIRFYTVKTLEGKEKVRYSIWGGPVEGNKVSADLLESIQLVFLGALRDAETEMRPNRYSKLASLLETITNDNKDKEQIIDVFRKANEEILKKDSLLKVEQIVNDNIATIEQEILKQHVQVGLVEPYFGAIAASLRAWIKPRWFYLEKNNSIYQKLKQEYLLEEIKDNSKEEENGIFIDVWGLLHLQKSLSPELSSFFEKTSNISFDLSQNGLGYNNILFMSAVLGDMKTSNSALFSLLLVEEPEAHLHPQLQELVFSFFEKNANEKNFQVIFTSHSPTLVSRIGIDRIVLLYERMNRIKSLSLSESNIDQNDRANLERYLDSTKSQMLFAKGIIFVEGISEALLLPVFAEYLGRPLDKYAVTIVNVDGVSFKPFADLLCYANNTEEQTIRAAIITDDDRCSDKLEKYYISKEFDYDCDYSELKSIASKLQCGNPSKRYSAIKQWCKDAHVKVYGAKKTFEYELAQYSNNISYLLKVISIIQPNESGKLEKKVNSLTDAEEKAICIWLYINYRSKYKGEIAQNLARLLRENITNDKNCIFNKQNSEISFEIPNYIKKAIFSVTEDER